MEVGVRGRFPEIVGGSAIMALVANGLMSGVGGLGMCGVLGWGDREKSFGVREGDGEKLLPELEREADLILATIAVLQS